MYVHTWLGKTPFRRRVASPNIAHFPNCVVPLPELLLLPGMTSRSPSRGRYRSPTRSPTSRSVDGWRRRPGSRSPTRSPTPPKPRRNDRYRSDSRSFRGRDSREPSALPPPSGTKVCFRSRSLLCRVVSAAHHQLSAPGRRRASVQEHSRGPPQRDIRPLRTHCGSRPSHEQDL